MHILAGILGLASILIILGDAFETIILPRRVTRRFRLTRLFFRSTWVPWRALCRGLRSRRRRESLLSIFGPLSLIMLLVLWALWLIVAFALLQWAFGSGMVNPSNGAARFLDDLYASGTTLTTLGLGDERPVTGIGRFLMVWEAGTGFGFLAIVIGYLPIIYQSFSRRERTISLLDARAGSPGAAGEMLRRYGESGGEQELHAFLRQWEIWAAELLESHISYPVLAFYRSQHSNESWISALCTILDTCTLILVGLNDMPRHQAQLTFAMARHACVDLAQVLGSPPRPPAVDRLPPSDWPRLRATLAEAGMVISSDAEAMAQAQILRRMYEPYLNSLADQLLLGLPPWLSPDGVSDNWQTSAWERAAQRLDGRKKPVNEEHW